ncbi:MAG TPA: hypothetical protein VM802_22415 [Chitinophaga sp.]|uniref:hypothetical protein n=1 Tax=Chitinophaga sp. TaxID=1869181 RepID=UPI002CE1DD1D|nr:hypothetical protein [Chitinophaga sp.]HVI47642.1 hypothetical protein [Chitinophaga sp.]
MKLHLTTYIIVIMFCSVVTCAQSTAPYLILKTSYDFAANPQKLNEATVVLNGKTYTKGVYGSYGKGFTILAGIGKMINNTFGFELNAEYIFGNKVTATYTESEDNTSGSSSQYVRSLLFKPVIVIRNSGDLLSIYTKLGLAISTATNRYGDGNVLTVIDNQSLQFTFKSIETVKAKVGFTACFGLAFRISPSSSFFTEINGQMISLPITRGRYTSYAINGVDQLPQLRVVDKSWVYKKSGYFQGTPNPNEPEPRLYEPANLSNIGIGMGILYHF